MRRFSIVVLVAIAFAVVYSPLPALAQDILGLSVRPTDVMPAGTGRGSADILRADDGGFLLSVDLSSAAEVLALDDFADATGWVVWAVDMDGVRHNVGTLDDNLVLEDAATDFLIARIFVTAEAETGADMPGGDRLFVATLRDVEEVDAAPDAEEAAEEAATEEEEAAEEETEEGGPDELPTTGGLLNDLLVLAMVAAGLLLVGLRLRTVRV